MFQQSRFESDAKNEAGSFRLRERNELSLLLNGMQFLRYVHLELVVNRLDRKRRNVMARKRVENTEGSLGYPGFVRPVFTKDSKPLGKRKRSLRYLGIVTLVLT
ncbi:hypothetical protein TNCV_3137441 [Trichonephila clavipes]|nr:hypothetical protein TNCV_3137441 [Trichonephila clavipes]